MIRPIKVLFFLAVAIAILVVMEYPFHPEGTGNLEELRADYSKPHIASVDHAKLGALQSNFDRPQDVTKTCISCHTERHHEVMASNHWNWEREAYIPGRGITEAGKKNLINNFCIGIGGSETSCTKCHAGYGWTDQGFDFEVSENIDCLVCHDQSDTYVKGSGSAGYPAASVNLGVAARSVGVPEKDNCGACHFYSGGGNNVKHGDLEEALLTSGQDVDVHMGYDGTDMNCTACHVTDKHQISGKLYSVSSMNRDRVSCEQCHTSEPHAKNILNEHTVKVACQTCHIPIYAKVNATKTHWDWSKAGRLKDGEPFHEEDEDGNHTYLSIKGEFVWEKNLEPEYTWFNGTADHYFIGDVIDPNEVVKMNTLYGDYADPNAKIIPVKIHRAKQIFDCENNMIIQPKLFAEKKGEGGYWQDFDWDIAAKMGMEHVGAPYSGNYCFVETEMYWPVNHMVSKADQAVSCEECHTPENSRLANLTDFYMPDRDSHASVELLGGAVLILSIIGVLVHMSVRLFTWARDRRNS